VKVLVERGGNIEAKEGSNNNPSKGKQKAVNTMMTPLHYATLRDHETVVEYLLEKGALVDAKAIVCHPFDCEPFSCFTLTCYDDVYYRKKLLFTLPAKKTF
jgi:ankyrin repeat protein